MCFFMAPVILKALLRMGNSTGSGVTWDSCLVPYLHPVHPENTEQPRLRPRGPGSLLAKSFPGLLSFRIDLAVLDKEASPRLFPARIIARRTLE